MSSFGPLKSLFRGSKNQFEGPKNRPLFSSARPRLRRTALHLLGARALFKIPQLLRLPPGNAGALALGLEPLPIKKTPLP